MNWPIHRTAFDDAYAAVTGAAHAGALGANNLPMPSAAQLKAGNYAKGRATVQGLRVVIEQPEGSIRRGVDASGKEWASRMAAHYGYFDGTQGADGDGVDVFIGPFPEAPLAFVVNQNNPGGGFDEHKVMLGFADEASARRAYLNSYERGWRGLGSIVTLTVPQLRAWLRSGPKSGPLKPINDERATMQKIYWNGTEPHGATLDQVMYAARRLDGADGLLLDSVTVADILEDSDGVLALDALVVENAQLQRLAERLRLIMDRSGGDVKVPAVQVSEPFRARGVTNVAAVYELSDGQTVSVFFHNPDTTPNKLGATDELISWKWLLNKKDITIVVAPEKGQDLNPRTVAQRIMKLAAKNSAAFQRANAKRAERLGNIQAIRDRITEKEGVLNGLLGDIAAARKVKDEKTVSESDKQRQFNVRSGQIVALLEAAGLKWSPDEGGWIKNGARVWTSSGAELGTAFLKFTIKGGAESVAETVDDDLSVPIAETASKVLAVVGAKAEKPEESAQDPIALVDAAYLFADATDAFKRRVAGSIDEADYSEFASAKSMDLKAKELGAKIRWGLGASLDSVEGDDGDDDGGEVDDFDADAEFDACPVEDAALDGDFKGHPFRGNQYKKASQHSHSAVRASIGARRAEKDGDHKAAKSAHKSAHYSHLAAAESTTGKARKYHRKMAKFHGGRAGVAMDSATMDAASDFEHNIVGKIMKGGRIMGRAVIAGDGKAMVFVGKSDDQRVQYWSKFEGKLRDAIWDEDDAGKMVEWLLKPQAAEPEPTPTQEPEPELESDRVKVTERALRDLAEPLGIAVSDVELLGAFVQWAYLTYNGVRAKVEIYMARTWSLETVGDSPHISVSAAYVGRALAVFKEQADALGKTVAADAGAWQKVSTGEYQIAIPESLGFSKGARVTLKKRGARWIDADSGSTYTSLEQGQREVEAWFVQLAKTKAEEAAARAEAEQLSKAAKSQVQPVQVYDFKDASEEAMGLLRIGASNPAPLSAYKTAVSVEQSAHAHGMTVRWEAVAEVPAMDDAGDGLFGLGSKGYVRGDLSYNGNTLASIYVRDDGLVNFDLDRSMAEWVDMDEEGWAGWHDAWTDVISKLRDVCDENGIHQKPASEILGEMLVAKGFTRDGGTFIRGDVMVFVKDRSETREQSFAQMMVRDAGAWVAPPQDLDDFVYGDRMYYETWSADEMGAEASTIDENATVLQAWAEGKKNSSPRSRLAEEPPHRNYRVSPAALNSAKLLPLVGKQLSELELDALQKWVKDAGFSAHREGSGLLVIGEGAPDIPDGAWLNRSEKEEAKRVKREAEARARDEAEAAEYASLPSSKWIDTKLGEDFTNFYNRLKLARYLDGKDDKFAGLTTHKWSGPMQAVGVDVSEGKTVADVLADLKIRYQGGGVVSQLKTEVGEVPSASAEDRAFLMSVIDGSAPDMLEPDLADKIEAAYSRNSGDAEMVSLFTQAVNAYTQAMLTATAGV